MFILSVVYRDRVVHNQVHQDLATRLWHVNRKPIPSHITSFDQAIEHLRTQRATWPCALTRGLMDDATIPAPASTNSSSIFRSPVGI